MINIKQMGITRYTMPIKNPMTFRCGVCGCVFEANGYDVKYDGDLDWYTAKCPCCDDNVHIWKRSDI